MDTMIEAMGEIFRVEISQDSNGFYVAKSQDLPGLFLMEGTVEEVITKMPGVLSAILQVQRSQEYRVLRARIHDGTQRAWVAFPAHLAASQLGAEALGAR